ncbi:MAG TPA: HAMP domain-containing sensor histidine kinase [Acidimicrobiia bacterium]|nr:HAMP domain-containing sensor histidine kinase [Acidimicrobiia bacterium]
MRRRLFWTIAGVAAVTGLLVLAASVYASQRAAVDATYRELQVSANEAVAIIDDFFELDGRRPGAVLEILGLLEGDELAPLFSTIRRTAGGSEIGFAAVGIDGTLRTNASIFGRIELADLELTAGETSRTTSTSGELVVVTPTAVVVGGSEVTLLVALAREAPIVSVRDQGAGLVLLVVGIVALAALGARLLSSQLASRLEPLAQVSRRVASGDMTARVPDLEDPELAEVAAAFNEMATELGAAREREREFILGVGHDLRTPLTTIGGYAEALEAGEIDDAELKRIGAVLGVQTRQLGRLIDDLSTLARLEQAEFGLRRERVDVGAHVSEVVDGFGRRAKELGVRLGVETGEGVYLETDADRLGQVAQNLVENALRHTPETGSVQVTVGEHGDQVVITVADSGTGIAESDLPRVFDRHFVGRQRRVRNEGTGLGLSIVKGLVDRMGGSVEAESTPGKGTTITVRLTR